MTVKPVKKKERTPARESEAGIPDHTHPEYDKLMAKLQEVESKISEGLDEGKPKHDEDKEKGGQEDPEADTGNWEPKKIEKLIRKVVREEIQGTPERDIGKDQQPLGPDNRDSVPKTKQPPNGEAPSGGGFDSDDKTNKDDGEDASGKVSKPKDDYSKQPIQKNRMSKRPRGLTKQQKKERAKTLVKRAKKLMNEANDPDPSQPNPGATTKDRKPMDGSEPNKGPSGGTPDSGQLNDQDTNNANQTKTDPEFGDETETNPEKNVPNNNRPDLKEGKQDTATRVYNQLKEKVEQEKKTNKQSVAGMTAETSAESKEKQAQFENTKQTVSQTVKEYLQKAGHGKAIRAM